MSVLERLKRSGHGDTRRVVVIGVHGIGKTSFAAGSEKPAFIAPDYEVESFPDLPTWSPKTYKDFHDILDGFLAEKELPFRTLAIDTMNWVQELAEAAIASSFGVNSFEGIPDKYNFKKWGALEMEAPRIVAKLDSIREKHKTDQIIMFHADVKKHRTPEGAEWDRYIPRGYKDFTDIFMQRSSAVLFAVYEVFEMKEDGKKKITGGDRILKTTWSPAYDAKNRLNLPETLPLDYDAYAQAVLANSPAQLRDRFLALLKTAEMPEAEKKKWTATDPSNVPADRLKAGIAKLEAMQPKPKTK